MALRTIADTIIARFGLEPVPGSDAYVSEFFRREDRFISDTGVEYSFRRPVGTMRTRSAERFGANSSDIALAYARWRTRTMPVEHMRSLLTIFNEHYEGTVPLDEWLDERAPIVDYERIGVLTHSAIYAGDAMPSGVRLERIAFDGSGKDQEPSQLVEAIARDRAVASLAVPERFAASYLTDDPEDARPAEPFRVFGSAQRARSPSR